MLLHCSFLLIFLYLIYSQSQMSGFLLLLPGINFLGNKWEINYSTSILFLWKVSIFHTAEIVTSAKLTILNFKRSFDQFFHNVNSVKRASFYVTFLLSPTFHCFFFWHWQALYDHGSECIHQTWFMRFNSLLMIFFLYPHMDECTQHTYRLLLD